MIIWIFMILDLITLVSVGIAHFGYGFQTSLLLMAAAYLVIKGGIFFSEPMSKVDVLIGAYIFLMAIFHFSTFVEYIIFAWFLYKLIFTLVG